MRIHIQSSRRNIAGAIPVYAKTLDMAIRSLIARDGMTMWISNGPPKPHVCATPIWALRKRPGAIWECRCGKQWVFKGRDIDGDAEFAIRVDATSIPPNYTPMKSPPGSVFNPETGKTRLG